MIDGKLIDAKNRLLRVRAVMTAQDHLRKPRQRMVRADGLILEDIERCCRYPAVGERIEQGSLLDQRPSGDVDDHRTGLDLAQRLFVERSEERRVGKEGVSTGRYRGSPNR